MSDWVKLFKENKWAFVAYTGFDNRLNTTRWHIVKSDSWSFLRHQLEAFGAEAVESAALGFTNANPYNGRPPFNTMLRGHVLFKPTRVLNDIEKFPPILKNILSPKFMKTVHLPSETLTSTDYVMPNFFVLLVRTQLPLGGRPYMPLEEKASYALLEHRRAAADSEESQKIDAKLKSLREEQNERAHASDFETLRHTHESVCGNLKTTLSTEYLRPPLDYLCSECQTFGQHYKDACYLWRATGHKEIATVFGPTKFTLDTLSTLAPKEEDAIFFSLMHKRAAKPAKNL